MKLSKLSTETIPNNIEGWWEIPEDLYHAGPGFGSSNVKAALKSPAHVKIKFPQSDAMKFGTAVHLALLEPNRFEEEYVLKPADIDLRTKGGKDFAKSVAGKKILSADQAEAIQVIRGRMKDSQTWLELASFAEPETCLYQTFDGVLLKGRCDLISVTEQSVTIVDLKTTKDAGEDFRRSAMGMGYPIQAALYCDLAQKIFQRPVTFIWAAIENAEPYGLAFYRADEPTLAYGRGKVMEALKVLKKAEREGFSQVYPDTIQPMSLPRWAEYELLNEGF
jgi:exodeoxyribonuclease VIII